MEPMLSLSACRPNPIQRRSLWLLTRPAKDHYTVGSCLRLLRVYNRQAQATLKTCVDGGGNASKENWADDDEELKRDE